MTEVIDREGVAAPARSVENASRRVYVEGSRPDLRVPFCEVTQVATRGVRGDVPNDPLRLYDTSGAHGDPEVTVAPETGLPPLRTPWITEPDPRKSSALKNACTILRKIAALYAPIPTARNM